MKQIDIQFKAFRKKGDRRNFFCTQANCDYNLNVKSIAYVPMQNFTLPLNWQDKAVWQYLPKSRFSEIEVIHTAHLGGAYEPAAELPNGFRMNILTPDSLDESIAEALQQLKQAVGNVAEFVAERLQYSLAELADCLSLEQIDAVALAIYNVEAREQGLIVGDQTGIGKGRVAAAFLRYAVLNGYKPIFFTEKSGLFSDIYRDLKAIHSFHFNPLIFNSDGSILDEDGDEIEGKKFDKTKLDRAIKSGRIPDDVDIVLCTYSQLATTEDKREYVKTIAKDNIIVMDESHNAGGEVVIKENTRTRTLKIEGTIGYAFQGNILNACKGVMFLSATYAKFPKNMPIYAANTCISDLRGTFRKEHLKNCTPARAAQELQGVSRYFFSLPAQEMISTALAQYGQFIRRERQTEGMSVNYITLDQEGADLYGVENLKDEHYALYENIVKMINRIQDFQRDYVTPYLVGIFEELAAEGERGQRPPSVASASIFSALFHLVNNVLLSIKSEAIADRAIMHLKEGRKVMIAVADTNETLLSSEEGEDNADYNDITGQGIINSDYTNALARVLNSLMKYYIKAGRVVVDTVYLNKEDLGDEAAREYDEIIKDFTTMTSGLSISPIDMITNRIKEAGFSVGECTGRKKRLEFVNGDYSRAKIVNADRYSAKQGKHISMCYNKFNNNELDVLIVNQSGSTGKSAHATNVGTNLKPEEVKQRVMLIGQAELDVNTEVQKRGRINRTGQFTHIPPIYEYIFSAIPCEKRFMMMLKNKLKSLDANTSANQKNSSESVLKSDDFFNEYGDQIVTRLIHNDEDTAIRLNDPLGMFRNPITNQQKQGTDTPALTVFGRMQVLTPKDQEWWYDTVLSQYNELVEKLKAEDRYDLEVKEADFRAEKLGESILFVGNNDRSALSASRFVTRYSIKKQAKFKSVKEIQETIETNKTTGLLDSKKVVERLRTDYNALIIGEEEREKGKREEQIEYSKRKIESIKAAIKKYIEFDMPDELPRKKEELKEVEDTLKNLEKGGFSTEFEDKLKRLSEKYDSMVSVLESCVPGSVFFYDNFFYILTQCTIDKNNDDANVFSRASAIRLTFITNDDMNKLVRSVNMAEDGLNELKEIVKTSVPMDDYEKFLNDDTKREEVSIITGGFVPLLGGSSEASIVTRYSLADGTYENGIVIRPIYNELKGMYELPKIATHATIPLNDGVIKAAIASMTSQSRVSFVETNSAATFSITGVRYGDAMRFRIQASNSSQFRELLAADEIMQFYEDPVNGLTFSEGFYIGIISDVRGFLTYLNNNASVVAEVPIAAVGNYIKSDDIDMSKYKPKPWARLTYDKSKIPTTYARNETPYLLIAEMGLLKFDKKTKKSEHKQTSVKSGGIEIVDYSEKAWAITGDTIDVKDAIKSMGGKFNKYLSCGAGWIVSKKNYPTRESVMNKLN